MKILTIIPVTDILWVGDRVAPERQDILTCFRQPSFSGQQRQEVVMETHKTCHKCGELKPLSSFFKRTKASDGHQSQCKICSKSYLDTCQTREYNRKYKQRLSQQIPTPEMKEQRRIHDQKYRARHPTRRAAIRAVGRAVKKGLLVRPNACDGCDNTELPILGHHSDYSKPLDVMWFCQICHKQWHKWNNLNEEVTVTVERHSDGIVAT